MTKAAAGQIVGVLLACCAAGCSSSSHGSAPTTAPAAATTTTAAGSSSTVRAYLEGAGASIVTIERASQALATGVRPARATCTAFLARAATVVGAPDWSQRLRGIPDPPLRAAIVGDLDDKLFLARACVSTTGLNTSAGEQRVYRLYRDRSRAVATQLAAMGVRL